MNAWPEDDGATLVALRTLVDDPAPVPPLPLPSVVRRGRRRRVARTAGGLGAATAAVLLGLLLLPGTGSGPVRLGPAGPATLTTPDEGPGALWLRSPQPYPGSLDPIPTVDVPPEEVHPVHSVAPPGNVNSRWDRQRNSGFLVVEPGQRVRQSWGTIWLTDTGRCVDFGAGALCTDVLVNDWEGSVTSQGGVLGGELRLVGFLRSRHTPARAVLNSGTYQVDGLVLTLRGDPGWSVWSFDGRAGQGLPEPGRDSHVVARLTVRDRDDRSIGGVSGPVLLVTDRP